LILYSCSFVPFRGQPAFVFADLRGFPSDDKRIMSTEAALLRTIRETPDDDTARLVFADFIQEEGDADRGEFIRVQVALARLPEDDSARRELEDREHILLAENEARWLGVPPDADGLTEWEFERGFLNEVAATPNFMLNEGADLCAAHPVRRWRVQCSQQDMGEDLRLAGQRPWFRRLESLDLAGWFEGIGELERFLVRADFERLRELDLTDRPDLAELPTVLERAPWRDRLKILRVGGRYGEGLDADYLARSLAVARLTELAVPGCQLTAQDIRGLMVANCCQELTSLNIRDNQIEPDGWDAFRFGRCKLRELDLSGTPLGAIGLEDVLRQPALSELRRLELNRCGSAVANIRALAGSRFWTQAEELRMQAGTIPENALDPLFASAGSPHLRVLDASENFFRDAGVAGLCGARWADSLTWLGLTRNYLTDAALATLAACPRLTRLRTLHLAYNNNHDQEGAGRGDRITDRGARALAESQHLANLRLLALSGTDVTTAGLDAILNGASWQLSGLGLDGCDLNASAIRVLAESPALARLNWLDLGGHYNGIDANSLLPLAESEHLSPMCELNLRGTGIDAETLTIFRDRLGRRLSE